MQVRESRVDALARAIAGRGSRQQGFGQLAAFLAGSLVGAATSAFADVGATGAPEAVLCPEGTTQCVVCVTTLNDPNNCGACGNVCPTPPNSRSICDGGVCGSICQQGFWDCDLNSANGCETNIQTDVNNCGACNHVCVGVNATAVCAAGICGYVCASGFQDCNNDPVGCETNVETDVNNCGACNHVCQGVHTTMACAGGNCVHGLCDTGWLDCDGNSATGCETNVETDVNNCGACNHVCQGVHTTMACAGGNCVHGQCDPGWDDCDLNAANGCETNIETDVNHCGACNNVCQGGHATWACAAGHCVITGCSFPWADCDLNAANGCETNLQIDVNNCGACRHVCPQGMACVAGVCT
jgi:hypothetical protein